MRLQRWCCWCFGGTAASPVVGEKRADERADHIARWMLPSISLRTPAAGNFFPLIDSLLSLHAPQCIRINLTGQSCVYIYALKILQIHFTLTIELNQAPGRIMKQNSVSKVGLIFKFLSCSHSSFLQTFISIITFNLHHFSRKRKSQLLNKTRNF